MKPVISVIIATYRRPALIKKCVEALAHQSFPKNNYEIIVVTDGPDTATRQQLQLLQQQPDQPALTCISLPARKGPAAARNAGWRIAKGELMVFTDDDCLPQYQCLEQYWQAYVKHRYAAIAFSGSIQVPLPEKPTDFEKNTARLEQARFVTANCACSRPALIITGGLDESFTMAWREDTALEFDLHEHNIPIVKVPGALIVHPARRARWGVSIREQKKSMFNALLYKKHTHLYIRYNTGKPPRYYYVMALLLLLSLLFSFNNPQLTLLCLGGWLLLTAWFACKRLRGTTRRIEHVLEMLFTSALIPLLSIFWNLYGSIKYKSIFL